MNGYYGYFKNNEVFAYDNSWATLISTDKENNVLEFSTVDFDGLIHMLKSVCNFASLYKSNTMFSFGKHNQDNSLLKNKTWASSLLIAGQIYNINEEYYLDGNAKIVRPVLLLVKCEDKFFKFIIHYGEYSLLKRTVDVFINSNEDAIELNYPFSIESINDDGSLRLYEDYVGSCDGFTVHLKKGDETKHHRPHVQCLMSGKEYNISIDENIEYLGKEKETRDIRFIIRQLKKDKNIIQEARTLWNLIPSNYKFEKNENGELIPPKKQ